nr:shikimate dehydrogenase [uncultured Rhodopila sp.]
MLLHGKGWNPNGTGNLALNITAPFKLDAFTYAAELRERAKLAGAANAMKFEGDRALADNFDGVGLVSGITRNLDCLMKGRRVLLLGAGGAVRGAIMPFLSQQPAEFVIANRTVGKAQALAGQFAPFGSCAALGYDAPADRGASDIVVNGTSASLRGKLTPVPAVSFNPDGLASELAYGKGLAPFLRVARGAGVARVADGVGMLVEQAAEAFAWWRGVRPETGPTIDRMTIPLT